MCRLSIKMSKRCHYNGSSKKNNNKPNNVKKIDSQGIEDVK